MENYNYLFECQVEGRDVNLQPISADIDQLLQPTGEVEYDPFDEFGEVIDIRNKAAAVDDENKIYDEDSIYGQLVKHREQNIVKDFKLRKIIMGQILKLHEDNLQLPHEKDFDDLFDEVKKTYDTDVGHYNYTTSFHKLSEWFQLRRRALSV